MSLEFDYIVMGSGAGGGPLACNLARAGFRVALIEPGQDPAKKDGADNLNYFVPALHGQSTENSHMSWDFFVTTIRTLPGSGRTASSKSRPATP